MKHIQEFLTDHNLTHRQGKAISTATNSYFSPAPAFYHSKFYLQVIQRYPRSWGHGRRLPKIYHRDQIRVYLHFMSPVTTTCTLSIRWSPISKLQLILSQTEIKMCFAVKINTLYILCTCLGQCCCCVGDCSGSTGVSGVTVGQVGRPDRKILLRASERAGAALSTWDTLFDMRPCTVCVCSLGPTAWKYVKHLAGIWKNENLIQNMRHQETFIGVNQVSSCNPLSSSS